MSDLDAVTDRLCRQLARVSEWMQHTETEADAQRRRLESAEDVELRRVARDRSEPSLARRTALMLLVTRHRRDATQSDLLAELIDDPDPELAREAVQFVPPFDAELTRRLHALLDDPREHLWPEAATVLARRKDPRLVPRLLQWLRHGDRPHRHVALASLAWLLPRDEQLDLLGRLWDEDGRDDEDRAVLASQMLELDDTTGLPFLEELARRLEGLSPFAALTIYTHHDAAKGLELMAWVLDRAAPDIQWRMAEAIGTRVNLPHLWTADAVTEARNWVSQQSESLRDGDTTA